MKQGGKAMFDIENEVVPSGATPTPVSEPMVYGPISIRGEAVEIDGTRIHFTSKEQQILAFLISRAGSTVTKEMILNHLYGGLDEPELRIIDVFICKVRKKIARANGGYVLIETVWGRGYMLPSLEQEVSAAS